MRIFAGIAGLSFLIGVVVACSGDDTSSSSSPPPSPPPCNQDPFSCPDGQTCWLVGSQAAPAFDCLNSGPKGVGDSCQLIFNQPQCGDDTVCWSVAGDPNVCTPYCDSTNPAHACPGGLQCTQVGIQGPSGPVPFFACRPEGGAGGAGGGGVGGAGGAGAGGAAAGGAGGAGVGGLGVGGSGG